MDRSYVYGMVRETRRTAIYAIRIKDELIDIDEAEAIAERMRDKIMARGEIATDVVVVQGDSKETLRLHGSAYSVNRVRMAMFNAAISWMPIELD